jgi:hypothetical protein
VPTSAFEEKCIADGLKEGIG